MKVLQNDARNKMKFNKAKTFSYNRLTDLRCEERRRVSQVANSKLVILM